MNRLTAIGLASLVAYGLLIASKYTGFVSAAREDKARPHRRSVDAAAMRAAIRRRMRSRAAPTPRRLPPPVRPRRSACAPLRRRPRVPRRPRPQGFRRRPRRPRAPSLTGDERYHLAKALEECQFATTINEDLAAYSAKQRRQFLAGLTAGRPRTTPSASPPTRPSTTRSAACASRARKISQKDIDELYAAAAQQGDAARPGAHPGGGAQRPSRQQPHRRARPAPRVTGRRHVARSIGLLETRDPEAMMIVGSFLAQIVDRAAAAHRPERRDARALGLPRRVLAGGVRHDGPDCTNSSHASRSWPAPTAATATRRPSRSSTRTSSRRPGRTRTPALSQHHPHRDRPRRTGALIGLTPKLRRQRRAAGSAVPR